VESAIGLKVAALTDIGMRRTTNQDNHAVVLASSPEMLSSRGHLLIVADGMGAHAAGELASKLAVDGIPHLYLKYTDLPPAEALLRAIRETNTEIHRRGQANIDFYHMGTTCSALVLLPQQAWIAHVGDSRVYRLRGQRLCQLTFDHSLQWELRASGQLPAGTDLAAIIPKNVITRSLGPNPHVEVDLEGPLPIAEGDIYLLCSDGLTGRVDDAEIGAILTTLPPDEAAQVLIDLANLRGGPDNITVVIAQVVGPDLVAPDLGEEASPAHRPRSQRSDPLVWALPLAALLLAGLLRILHYPRVAAATLVLAVGALLAGLAWRWRSKAPIPHEPTPRPGHGPYAEVVCTPNGTLVGKLKQTLDELREAAREGEWTIAWEPLDEAFQGALAAEKSGNYVEAVRQLCRGISYVMSALRSQGGGAASGR
jgi:serine/threonine protein phosphatase PrpC